MQMSDRASGRRRRSGLQTSCALQPRKPAIECPQRQVAGLTRGLQDQAIRKSESRLALEENERECDNIRILHNESLVLEQLADG